MILKYIFKNIIDIKSRNNTPYYFIIDNIT